MTIIISCGAVKLQTSKPVQAHELYIGTAFRVIWKKVVTLDPDIRILSAGYGLLYANDMILPYERKMDPRWRNYFLERITPIKGARCILSKEYAKAVPFAKQILPKPLPIGKMLQAVNKIPDGKHVWTPLKNGKLRSYIDELALVS